MKIQLKTWVSADLAKVWSGFDQKLFERLSPPFPFLKIVRFEGCRAGDWVELELDFLLFRQAWHSLITEQESTKNLIYFVDEGKKLPFPLKYWHHKHVLEGGENGTWIKDEIIYRSPFVWLDYVVFPFLFFQFWYRKPIYKKYFAK